MPRGGGVESTARPHLHRSSQSGGSAKQRKCCNMQTKRRAPAQRRPLGKIPFRSARFLESSESFATVSSHGVHLAVFVGDEMCCDAAFLPRFPIGLAGL